MGFYSKWLEYSPPGDDDHTDKTDETQISRSFVSTGSAEVAAVSSDRAPGAVNSTTSDEGPTRVGHSLAMSGGGDYSGIVGFVSSSLDDVALGFVVEAGVGGSRTSDDSANRRDKTDDTSQTAPRHARSLCSMRGLADGALVGQRTMLEMSRGEPQRTSSLESMEFSGS